MAKSRRIIITKVWRVWVQGSAGSYFTDEADAFAAFGKYANYALAHGYPPRVFMAAGELREIRRWERPK